MRLYHELISAENAADIKKYSTFAFEFAIGATWSIALDTRNGWYFKKFWRAFFGPTTPLGKFIRSQCAPYFSNLLFDPITATDWNTYDFNPGNPLRQIKNWFKNCVRPYRRGKATSSFFHEFCSPLRRIGWLLINSIERVLNIILCAFAVTALAACVGIVLVVAAAILLAFLCALPLGILFLIFSFGAKILDSIFDTWMYDGLNEFAREIFTCGLGAWGATLGGVICLVLASPFIALFLVFTAISWLGSEVTWFTLTLSAIAASPFTSLRSLLRLGITAFSDTSILSKDPQLQDWLKEGKQAANRLTETHSHRVMLEALYCAKRIHKRALEMDDQKDNGILLEKDHRFAFNEMLAAGYAEENVEGTYSQFTASTVFGKLFEACNEKKDYYLEANAVAILETPLIQYYNTEFYSAPAA